jgi:regulator of sigma E protease
MDTIINWLGSGSALLTLIGFLFVLTVVVFFHELGHFLVARWCGVAVKVFSIGFGPEIVGFTDRKGTRWRLAWIPLGGYVKFIDDENVASASGRKALERLSSEDRKRSFQGKPLGHRAAIVAAGPIANFLLAILIFALLAAFFGEQTTSAKVDAVTPGSAAERAGFLPGDLVVSIDGRPIDNFSEMQEIVSSSAGETLTFVVKRADAQVQLEATPEVKQVTDRFGNKFSIAQLGIQRQATPDEWSTERHDLLSALWIGVKKSYAVIERSVVYLANVVMGRESADQLGGPIRIAQVSGQVASLGFVPLLSLAALISVSIGFINLFPIPMLDGGHLLYYALEGIRGRPLSERSQEIGFRVGLFLVLLLLFFATWNDVSTLISQGSG